MNEDKYKKRHIGKFKGCLRKINELGKKIGSIKFINSCKLLTAKDKKLKNKYYNNPKWSELSQITRETHWNKYANMSGPYTYIPGFTEDVTYGFGWKNPFPELIKREKILKEKYKYKNGKMRKVKDYVSKETIENEERMVKNQIEWRERHERDYKIYLENIILRREKTREWYVKKKQEDADKIKNLKFI
jgi:hypothetical protein